MGTTKRTNKTSGQSTKETRGRKDPSEDQFPIWTFTEMDKAGVFAFDISREDFDLSLVFGKMIEYSNMKWSEIRGHTHGKKNKSKHHFLTRSSLSKEALERLTVKHLDNDDDSIFSFALNGMVRVIGIRKNEFFKVIWYDPRHQFCPSTR